MQKQSFQILNERLLNRLLEVPGKQQGVKAVSSPSAQTTTLRAPVTDIPQSMEVSTNNLARLKKHSESLYNLYLFMLSSASRVSEALQINFSHIQTNGNVKLKASKGSITRIVNCGLALTWMLEQKKLGLSPWQELNRHFVYHRFKYFSIEISPRNSSKKAVTHCARHIALNQIQLAEQDISLTQKFAGHKNQNSTEHYVKNKILNSKNSKRSTTTNIRSTTDRSRTKK